MWGSLHGYAYLGPHQFWKYHAAGSHAVFWPHIPVLKLVYHRIDRGMHNVSREIRSCRHHHSCPVSWFLSCCQWRHNVFVCDVTTTPHLSKYCGSFWQGIALKLPTHARHLIVELVELSPLMIFNCFCQIDFSSMCVVCTRLDNN